MRRFMSGLVRCYETGYDLVSNGTRERLQIRDALAAGKGETRR